MPPYSVLVDTKYASCTLISEIVFTNSHQFSLAVSIKDLDLLGRDLLSKFQEYSFITVCSTVQNKLEMLTTMVLPSALGRDCLSLTLADGLLVCQGYAHYYRLCDGRIGEVGC